MTLYMPPLSTKKRGGEQKTDSDTKRVFGNYEENLPASKSHYSTTHSNIPSRRFSPAKSRTLSPTRQHNPHPSQVGFLMQDCRLLNAPICDVKPQAKEATQDPSGDMWWKWKEGQGEVKKVVPKYSYNSTNRDQFRTPEKAQSGQTRHGSNPSTHTSGIVPITSLPSEKGPRLLVEHISYQHQYDSRTNPSQPIRGKKHGSFVWDCFHPVSPAKLTANRTTLLSAPWASNTQDDMQLGEATIGFQKELGLGTLDSTIPRLSTLPSVAS
ncbi:ciliary microtubule inner protein 6-like [Asterias amurensis]|uniref:ciliary microtubule inner protein 6-like n=1 Tax=Asterias amurensis TaxID=7602 RepID=UPI003AB8932C